MADAAEWQACRCDQDRGFGDTEAVLMVEPGAASGSLDRSRARPQRPEGARFGLDALNDLNDEAQGRRLFGEGGGVVVPEVLLQANRAGTAGSGSADSRPRSPALRLSPWRPRVPVFRRRASCIRPPSAAMACRRA